MKRKKLNAGGGQALGTRQPRQTAGGSGDGKVTGKTNIIRES